MNAAPQTTIYLADYQPPAFLVDSVDLTFHLSPDATQVTSRIAFRPNPDATSRLFQLDGQDMTLQTASIDGVPVTPVVTATGLTCDVPDAPFIWDCTVTIAPAANTALEGLYMSNGMYCTQCEAEGFRKITYYPDRPDVLAVFTVRIHSDLPVLLSNGNPVTTSDGFAAWHDPWPKPAYLFALVAGDLVAHPDRFTTSEGRDVALNIYVRPGDLDKCAFGMSALKASMTWDEQVYGRAYDLDIFNIVAVDDFNMGAMENKGLNIFNSSCVLASSDTATDADFERIEAIIAHEYFHNWTGNRITCRDWFQLCLKEGLTVFRDQQFTGDMRSHAVKRIDDASVLRAAQFREDAGPLSHPVRPASFVEINNFYTATVYEKGAEVVGMLKRLVGDADYAKALTLYFDRHDGQAATIEDWLAVFTDATGRDLTQFARWYSQSGTPHLSVKEDYTASTYSLTFTQNTPITAAQPDPQPMVIPIAVGLLAKDGTEIMPTTMLEMTEGTQTFTFDGVDTAPVASILRGFSAPVVVTRPQPAAERAFLLAHDTDPFNRWDAAQMLGRDTLMAMVREDAAPDAAYLDGLAAVLRDDALDPAFRARVLGLPSQDDIAAALARTDDTPDPAMIHVAHEALRLHIAQHLQDTLPRIYADYQVTGPYSPAAKDAGFRALTGQVMHLMSRIDGGQTAASQFASADNMTQQLSSLAALLTIGKGQPEATRFEAQWSGDRLVMNKLFGMQASCAAPATAAATTAKLAAHPAFDIRNPNRFRAVFGGLARNFAGFHDPSGASYDLIADWVIKLDPINPQTAAGMSQVFATWSRYGPDRQAQMCAALDRIAGAPGLSGDTAEMVARMLEAA